MSPVNREHPGEGHGQLLITRGTVLSVSTQSVGIGGLKIKVVSLSDCTDNRYWVYCLANDSVTQIGLVRLLRSCTRYLVEKVDTGDHSVWALLQAQPPLPRHVEIVPPGITETRRTLKTR